MVPCMSWGAFSIVVAVVGKTLNGKPMDYPYYVSLLFSGLWYLSTIFGLVVIGVVVHTLVRRLSGGGVYYWLGNRIYCTLPNALSQACEYPAP